MTRPDPDFWCGKRVFVTGHTGFKGAWLVMLLRRLGCRVAGYSLQPSEDGAFALLSLSRRVEAVGGDVRDPAALRRALESTQPDLVVHLAAQSCVRQGYADPVGTFSTNVQGTIDLLDALRGSSSCKAALFVTSDKVYRNDRPVRPFVETDELGGKDPYSASKAACEMAVATYLSSFSSELPPVATARAGNVIGGGDAAPDRLVPDLGRAWLRSVRPVLRSPRSRRSFVYVLDVLEGYLLYLERLAGPRGGLTERSMNFGPGAETDVSTVVELFQEAVGSAQGWSLDERAGNPPEALQLPLDSARAAATLGWRPRVSTADAVRRAARWYATLDRGQSLEHHADGEVASFLA